MKGFSGCKSLAMRLGFIYLFFFLLSSGLSLITLLNIALFFFIFYAKFFYFKICN